MPIKEINDNNFDEKIKSAKKPVLVDFWAPWCGPCKMQAPILEAVAEEIGDKALIVKINVDENQEASSQYGIMSIPTLILFKDGEPVEHLVGLQQKEYIKKKIKDIL